MDASTWKSFCKAAGEQKGYIPLTERPHVPQSFKCDRCGKEWSTGIPLDGTPHKAIQNKCGGIWRIAEAVREKTAQAVEGSPSSVSINGEVYEVDNG